MDYLASAWREAEMKALFQVWLLLTLHVVLARPHEMCFDKAVPLDQSAVDQEFTYPLSCHPSHADSVATIKLTRWGVYLRYWTDGHVVGCERSVFFCFTKYNNTPVVYDQADDKSRRSGTEYACPSTRLRRFTVAGERKELRWSVTKAVTFLEHVRRVNCDSPQNPLYDGHRFHWDDVKDKLVRDKVISAAINYLHGLAHKHGLCIHQAQYDELDSDTRSCVPDSTPVERAVINTQSWHKYNSIGEEPLVEKWGFADGGCSSGGVKYGTYLSIFEWGIHHEPWHYKPNCVCHGFVHFQFASPGELYYRNEVQWNESEQLLRPKLQCNTLPVHKISIAEERDSFIEMARAAYAAAKRSRMPVCLEIDADGVPSPSTTFDWNYVKDQLERDRIANAVITFLEGVAYSNSFCLEWTSM